MYANRKAEVPTANLINDKMVQYQLDDKTSLEYSLTYTGFKEDIVVSEYTGQTEYEFTLLTEGLELEEIDGSYYLIKDYQVTCTHELGHALGYLGHSKSETDVMYYQDSDTYTLSFNEITHLKQVYQR